MKCEPDIHFPMNDNLNLFIYKSESLSVMKGGLWFLYVWTGTSKALQLCSLFIMAVRNMPANFFILFGNIIERILLNIIKV